MIKKYLLTIAIILLAFTIVFINLWKSYTTQQTNEIVEEEANTSENIPGVDLSQVQEGKLAPDFELTTLEGKTANLSDYKGKKVILNFWATWCPPCKAEMPHMQNFYENNKDNGIEVLTVNLTNMEKSKSDIEKFVKDYSLSFAVLLDEEGTIGMQYQAFTIPTSYIIDSNGIISKEIVGPMDEDMMISLTEGIK
ncbi:peroxiredoxin family protein [Robertmurraya sp.]|uniref:peroxiredoxin family protein n=1 Tax=Robertmurraya sp. TaxID=2837525 RepID=UPI003703FF2E